MREEKKMADCRVALFFLLLELLRVSQDIAMHPYKNQKQGRDPHWVNDDHDDRKPVPFRVSLGVAVDARFVDSITFLQINEIMNATHITCALAAATLT